MKKRNWVLGIIGILLIKIIFIGSAKIKTKGLANQRYYGVTHEIDTSKKLKVSMLETGYAETLESFVFKGGSWFAKRRLSHVAVLIDHPEGRFVFDTGLGSQMEDQFQSHFSGIDQGLFKFNKLKSLHDQLVENGDDPNAIEFMIPSHLHFDHASGIEDFNQPVVWVTLEEYNHAIGDSALPPAFIKSQYDSSSIEWNFIEFNDGPYEVFDQCMDVFNDGTVVLVPLPGHTNGSIGMFVNNRERKFFTGDLTWAAEAIYTPAEKHFIPRSKVDGNREAVMKTILKVNYLTQMDSSIKIIPAHDYDAYQLISQYPAFGF